MRKTKNVILTGLTGLILQGCANLPNIYKRNLTVESPAYKQAILKEDFQTTYDSNNLEHRMRNLYVLGDLDEFYSEKFNINSFRDKKNKISYCKWKSKNPKEIIIYLNGLESHSGWFSESAQKLSKQGVIIYGLDRRGSGLNTRINGNEQDWINDVDKIINIAKKENPNCDINLASLCFGARVASAYAIENPNKINSLIYISPGFNVKVKPNCLETMSIILDSIGLQTNTDSVIKNDKMFTTNPRYLEFLKNDKLRTRKVNSDDYLDGQKLLEKINSDLDKINIPSLVLLAEKDKIVDNEKTLRTVDKFGKKPEIIKYDAEHTLFFDNNIKHKFLNDISKFILNN